MTNKTITSSHKKVTSRTKREISELGKNLLRARDELSWTQEFLCKETGKFGSKALHFNTIYNIENGITGGGKESHRVLKKTITAALGRPYPWDAITAGIINKNSLAQFIKDSQLVTDIDHTISKAQKPALRIAFSDDFAEFFAERMHLVKIKTIQELEEQLKQREDFLKEFCVGWFKSSVSVMSFVPRGISISFLSNLLVFEKYGVKGLTKFFEEHRYDKKLNPRKLARGVKKIYEQVQKKMNR